MPAWLNCPACHDYWCTIHNMHVHDCECPPVEEWTTDPYSHPVEGENMEIKDPWWGYHTEPSMLIEITMVSGELKFYTDVIVDHQSGGTLVIWCKRTRFLKLASLPPGSWEGWRLMALEEHESTFGHVIEQRKSNPPVLATYILVPHDNPPYEWRIAVPEAMDTAAVGPVSESYKLKGASAAAVYNPTGREFKEGHEYQYSHLEVGRYGN